MGTVLAMKTILAYLGPVGVALALAGCGNNEASPIAQVASTVATQVTGSTAPVDVRAQITPELIASAELPFILVDLPARDATATIVLFATTGNRTDWRTADGASVVLVDDVVIATRGLGADLFLADIGDLPQALANGSGTVTRRHQWLDGENQVFAQSIQCRIADAGFETISLVTGNTVLRKTTETCEPESTNIQQFTNEYWTSPISGRIVKSNQWVSSEVGAIILEYVRR